MNQSTNQTDVIPLPGIHQPMERTTERENFYRWIETCPLTNYRISDADKKYVTYTFQFNSDEPDMDQLYDQVLSDLQK
jgi:hypothetical protein